MDIVKCMLHLKQLSKIFLIEVVSYLIYLLNSCLIKSFYGKTPQEAWNDRKPNLII